MKVRPKLPPMIHGHDRWSFRKWLLVSLATIKLSAAFFAGFSLYYYQAPGPLAAPTTVLFKHGMGFLEIVDNMADQGVIRYPWLFKIEAVAVGAARKFKAGEYAFSPAITPKLVMDMIAEGRVVVHKLTIPEGLKTREIIALLNSEKLLEGDLDPSTPEGSLLPETYHYTYGDQRSTLIARMHSGMSQTLDELWDKRASGLPFKTPEEALTMASIVEKETGVSGERPHVASVFINRLRKGMKLQTDPTVTYGIEKEKGPMNRSLVLSDLRTPTAYNTYVIDGLPPGPIANPGRAAIEAVLHPANTKDLYFVATGNGGHNFSSTFDQHNNFVKEYHQALDKKHQESSSAKKESKVAAESASAEPSPPAESSAAPAVIAPPAGSAVSSAESTSTSSTSSSAAESSSATSESKPEAKPEPKPAAEPKPKPKPQSKSKPKSKSKTKKKKSVKTPAKQEPSAGVTDREPVIEIPADSDNSDTAQ